MRRNPHLSQADIARACGVKTPSVNDWVSGKTKTLKAETARLAAQMLGCDQNWLANGVGSPGWRLAASAAEPAEVADSYRAQALEASKRMIDLESNPDYPTIRRVKIKVSAGVSGYAIELADDDGAPIVFRRDWFERNRYRPNKLVALRVSGSSMEPTLYDGDLVVINTEQTTPREARVFAVNYAGELVIKRVFTDAGAWVLRSDNPDKMRFPDKRLFDGANLIGEVVYRQSERV
ncbi:MAG: hypothetical protein RLZZ524_1319 [Pseudomonadota bacterium]